MIARRIIAPVLLLVLQSPGCSGGPERANRLALEDFAGPSSGGAVIEPTTVAVAEEASGGTTGMAGVVEGATVAEDAASAPTATGRWKVPAGKRVKFNVDAMVGQVNGQPIYAREVLEPLAAELEVMGRQLSGEMFRNRLTRRAADGSRLIPDCLTGIVIDALILGEAERDLSDREQFAVKNRLKEIREELLSQFYNSITLAESSLRESTGKGLEETLEGRRKAMIVERYVRQKLLPKVNVTRRDIENYYHMHQDEFNESPGRKIRMIRTDVSDRADEIKTALAGGTPFIEVASSRLNRYKPDEGGLYSERTLGENIFGPVALNDAVLALDAGQYSARIQHGGFHVWLFIEEFFPGGGRSLTEAQEYIRKKLHKLQYVHLFDEYRSRLFTSYVESLKWLQKVGGPDMSLQKMSNILVDIAVSRYAVLQ